MSDQDITYEMFKSYVCTKAYDIIGSGAYKTFLVKCRDNNDEWAMQVHHNMSCMLDNVKSITSLILQLRRFSASGLGAICKDIITNTTPPSFVGPTWNVCQISGQHTASCMELQRSQHKPSGQVYIHEQYIEFLNLLWFVCKIEHVVRNYTRQWLRQLDPATSEQNMAEMCRLFACQDEQFRRFFHAFEYGRRYVRTSLQRYSAHVKESTPLNL
eukprot:997511-Rhodomonas_salina.3